MNYGIILVALWSSANFWLSPANGNSSALFKTTYDFFNASEANSDFDRKLISTSRTHEIAGDQDRSLESLWNVTMDISDNATTIENAWNNEASSMEPIGIINRGDLVPTKRPMNIQRINYWIPLISPPPQPIPYAAFGPPPAPPPPYAAFGPPLPAASPPPFRFPAASPQPAPAPRPMIDGAAAGPYGPGGGVSFGGCPYFGSMPAGPCAMMGFGSSDGLGLGIGVTVGCPGGTYCNQNVCCSYPV